MRGWRVAGLAIGLVLLVTVVVVTIDARAQRAATQELLDQLDQLDGEELEAERLRREVSASALEQRQATSLTGRLVGTAPFLTVVLAAVGALVTVWKQIDESAKQRESDRRQAERELEERKRVAEAAERQRERDLEERERVREQAAIESERRFDEKFAATLTDLGSDNPAVSAGAAWMLRQLLDPRYADHFESVFGMLLTNVRLDHTPLVRDLLVDLLADALRTKLLREGETALEGIDLARARLPRIGLADLRLRGADIAFADLTGADLTGCDLSRARGYEVDLARAQLSRSDLTEARLRKAVAPRALFHDTRLVSADLRGADLAGADFSRARLQSAHLEEADLTGAKFPEATLADTFLIGVRLDEAAIRSLSRAVRWRDAHLDPDARERLEQASVAGSRSADVSSGDLPDDADEQPDGPAVRG